MNKLLLLTCWLFLLATAPPSGGIEWLGSDLVDVGDIAYNEAVEHVFEFRNSTDAPLLIENVRTSCGCTTTDWQDSPVAVGDTGQIRVTYDAASRGYFRKYVKVYFFGHRGGHKMWLEGYVE